jgi:hypothetical protein
VVPIPITQSETDYFKTDPSDIVEERGKDTHDDDDDDDSEDGLNLPHHHLVKEK